MDTSEKREPLLSDGAILEMDDQELDKYNRFNFAHRVRDFYEDKIASGEFIRPDMFYDGMTGLVSLRILGSQWMMPGVDLHTKLSDLITGLHLDMDMLSTKEHVGICVDLMIKHGERSDHR